MIFSLLLVAQLGLTPSYERHVLTESVPFSESKLTPAIWTSAVISDSGRAILIDGVSISRWNLKTRRRETALVDSVSKLAKKGTDRIRVASIVPDYESERVAIQISNGIVGALPVEAWTTDSPVEPLLTNLDAKIERVVFAGKDHLAVLAYGLEGSRKQTLLVYRIAKSSLELEFQTELQFRVCGLTWDVREQKLKFAKQVTFSDAIQIQPFRTYEFDFERQSFRFKGELNFPTYAMDQNTSPVVFGDFVHGQYAPEPGMWYQVQGSRGFVPIPLVAPPHATLTDSLAISRTVWSTKGRFFAADVVKEQSGLIYVAPIKKPEESVEISKPEQPSWVKDSVAAISNNGHFVLSSEVNAKDSANASIRWILHERKEASGSSATLSE